MSDAGRGLPLLSGLPPPPPSHLAHSDACRKCGKEFNVIFTRSRKCNHCGYLYCHNCSDYQALMPRTGDTTGYDVMPVCGYCIEYLTITAGGKAHLKSLPLAKLKKYASAYNIRITHAVEKDDVIEAIVAARASNGCLPADNENYYRRHSIPATDQRSGLRNMFRSQPPNPSPPPPPPPPQSRPQEFPRPDLAQDHYQANSQRYPSNSAPPNSYPHANSYPNAYPHHYQPHPNPPPPPRRPNYGWDQYPGQQPQYHQQHPGPTPGGYPQYNYNPPPQAPRHPPAPHQRTGPPPPPPPRPQQPSQPAPRPQPPAPPSLDELLNMSSEDVGKLSISTLKSVLFTNHVNAGQVLEKGELVKKVLALADDERRERERQRQAQELEELERIQREEERREAQERARRESEEREQERERQRQEAAEQWRAAEASSEEPSVPQPPPKPSSLDRGGLCVVCQDEEANIAIVDCGHLAMCRGCSDLIMNSSRECPLCRTRIVTEARLLRIFKS